MIMEKSFFDTEFIETKDSVELVSLGIVTDTGRKFYAESSVFDDRNAVPWVTENVLSKLKWYPKSAHYEKRMPNTTGGLGFIDDDPMKNGMEVYGDMDCIRDALTVFYSYTPSLMFFAYCGATDWINFYRIWGRLLDMPARFPNFYVDLRQMMWERGLDKDWKRKILPPPENEHFALSDAEWDKKLFEEIIKHPLA